MFPMSSNNPPCFSRGSAVAAMLWSGVPALVLSLLVAAPLTAHAYPLKMPWRGDGLPGNTYMTYFVPATPHGDCPEGQAICQMDLWATRWDSTLKAWSSSKTEGQSTYQSPADHVTWGMDLFSPVDGEVISCWRHMPDDDGPGGLNCPGGMQNCMRAGNHVTIKTSDNRIVFFGHLMQDSIPWNLCPKADEFIYDDPVVCPAIGSTWTKIVPGTVLGTPRKVRKGEKIGTIGESGSSAFPHLHLHVKPLQYTASNEPCVGQAETIEFDEAWRQSRFSSAAPTDAGWARLNGVGAPFASSVSLLWPDPTGIRTDTLGVEEGTRPAIAMTSNAIGTVGGAVAYRKSNTHLAVVGFSMDFDDTFGLGPIQEEGTVSELDLAPVSLSMLHVVAAVRNSANKLQLIPYHFGPNATLERGTVGHTSAGDASAVRVTTAPTHTGVTVAYKNGSGNLTVSNFGATTVAPGDLQIDARGTATSASSILDVDIARVVAGRGLAEASGFFKGVVTVERRSSDNALVARTWEINSNGSSVSQSASLVATKMGGASLAVADVDVTVVGNTFSREFAVVSVREAVTNSLRVQTYEISTTGALALKSEWVAGPITELSSAKAGTRDLAIGVRTSGNFSVLSFDVDAGGILGRSGTRDGGAISAVSVAAVPVTENLASAVVGSSGDVTLLHYITNYSSVR